MESTNPSPVTGRDSPDSGLVHRLPPSTPVFSVPDAPTRSSLSEPRSPFPITLYGSLPQWHVSSRSLLPLRVDYLTCTTVKARRRDADPVQQVTVSVPEVRHQDEVADAVQVVWVSSTHQGQGLVSGPGPDRSQPLPRRVAGWVGSRIR